MKKALTISIVLLLFASVGVVGQQYVIRNGNPFQKKSVSIKQVGSIVVQPEVEIGSKIVITCNHPVPEGGKLQILWNYPSNLEVEDVGGRLFAWGKPGTYSITAVIIPLKTITVQDQTFDVISGAIINLSSKFKIVGKIDEDEEEEDDKVNIPFPSEGFACLILKEASKVGELPEAQRAIFTSSRILRYSQKAQEINGDPFFRIWDDDYSEGQLQNVGQHLRDAYRDVKKQANGQLPWIAVTNGKNGFSGPLPGSIEETINLLNKYAK